MLVTTTELTHSQRLRRRLDLVLPALAAASVDLLEHPRFRERYVEYGFTLHAIVRASVRLMETARGALGSSSARMPWRRRSSPTWSSTSRRRCTTTSGSSRISRWSASIARRCWSGPCRPPSRGWSGPSTTGLSTRHPGALLGYLLVIEGNPPTAGPGSSARRADRASAARVPVSREARAARSPPSRRPARDAGRAPPLDGAPRADRHQRPAHGALGDHGMAGDPGQPPLIRVHPHGPEPAPGIVHMNTERLGREDTVRNATMDRNAWLVVLAAVSRPAGAAGERSRRS